MKNNLFELSCVLLLVIKVRQESFNFILWFSWTIKVWNHLWIIFKVIYILWSPLLLITFDILSNIVWNALGTYIKLQCSLAGSKPHFLYIWVIKMSNFWYLFEFCCHKKELYFSKSEKCKRITFLIYKFNLIEMCCVLNDNHR